METETTLDAAGGQVPTELENGSGKDKNSNGDEGRPIKRGRGRPRKNATLEQTNKPKQATDLSGQGGHNLRKCSVTLADVQKSLPLVGILATTESDEPDDGPDQLDLDQENARPEPEVPVKKGRRGRPRKKENGFLPQATESSDQSEVDQKDTQPKRGRGRPRKSKVQSAGSKVEPAEPAAAKDEGEEDGEADVPPDKRPKRNPGTDTKPGQVDTGNGNQTLKKFVGAHVSIAGGIEKAVGNAVLIGAKAFALFLHSQRQWATKPLATESIDEFRKACQQHSYSPHLILPHGSYLINLGAPDPQTLEKSRALLLEEFKKCEQLGLTLLNFHPGSTCGKITIEECLDKIADSINSVLSQTSGVTAVIENMSCQGNTVGGKFEEIRDIINRVVDKSRVGVCLDTCHAFAAGYDISNREGYEKMMDDFNQIIGLQYLKGVHLNDSKDKVGCHKDRHENIGEGHIGLDTFEFLVNDPRFDNVPLILETPSGVSDEDEISTLYSLIG